MSKRADPTLIGAFVVGAVLLMVLAVLLFSSGDLFVPKPRLVMYFEGSVHGLQSGAPVSFRGVRIGTVKEVKLAVDIQDYQIYIPVYIEIDPRRLNGTRGEDYYTLHNHIDLERLIKSGLRARLQLQSLLTGQLYVDLDFMPDKPAKFIALDDDVNEIPTVANTTQKLTEMLEENDLNRIVGDFGSVISSFNQLLNMPELKKIVYRVDHLLRLTESLTARLDMQSTPLLNNLNAVMVRTQTALAAVEKAALRSDTVLVSGDSTLQEMSQAFVQMQQALQQTRDLLGENSQLRYELTTALKEIAGAARAIRSMADTLDREPEALLSGKSNTGDR